MKKMFFYAAVACVAFASCQKDNDVVNPNNNVEEETLEAIEFAMGNKIEVVTRGTGAVGDKVESLNVWAGEKLNVYMFEQDKMKLKLAINPTDNLAYFNNAEITAPNDTVSSPASYGPAKYYASNKTYDFYAYHADKANYDVKGDSLVTPKPNKDTTAYVVPFTIDGTQDLMVAKAKMNPDEIAMFAEKKYDATKVYSAYAARRGVQPRFAFQHELSRFVFNVTASKTDSTALGLVIDSIKVVDAKINGTMTVAAKEEKDLGVTFDAITDTLILMDRTRAGVEAMAMVPVELDSLGEKVRLGESMLLAPGVSKYNVEVHYSQVKDGKKLKDIYEATIALKDNKDVFKAGAQYDVNITVYGFQKIELICDLTRWEDGEDVELDSEQ